MEKVEYLESPSSATTNVISAFRIPINGYQPGRNSIKLQSEHFYPAVYTDSGAQSEGCTLNDASFNIGYSNNRKSFYIAYDGTVQYVGVDQYFDWSTDFGKWTTYSYELSPNLVKLIIDDNVLFSSEINFNSNVETKQFYCFGRLSDHYLYGAFGLYGKKKWMKFYCDDKLERDLIPALDRTGTPCMYDKVTRKRFYNAGTGEFSYSLDNSHLIPKDYIKVDYLESTGTQWIDTCNYLDDNVEVRTNLQYTSIPNGGEVYWFYGNYSSHTKYVLFGFYPNGNQGWCVRNNFSTGFNIPSNSKTYEKCRINHSKDYLKINAEECSYWGTQIVTPDDVTKSLYLFARHHKEGYAQKPVNGKMWYFDVLYNGVVANRYIPCLDPTGTPCMFDTVTQQPFYNSGTGDFLYPSPSSATTYSMRRPQAEYAKMTDTGVRRLYHVPVDYDGSIEEYANEYGFKLLNETESPIEEGKYYAFRWVETDTELTTEWYETEPPTDELGNPIENTNEPQASTFELCRPTPIDETVYTNTAKWAMMTDTGVRRLYKTPKDYEGSLEDYAIQCGYKQLIETECPNEEGKYYNVRWMETDTELMTEWYEIDQPHEEIFEEILDNSTK